MCAVRRDLDEEDLRRPRAFRFTTCVTSFQPQGLHSYTCCIHVNQFPSYCRKNKIVDTVITEETGPSGREAIERIKLGIRYGKSCSLACLVEADAVRAVQGCNSLRLVK